MDALYLYTIRLALNQSVNPLSNNNNIIQQQQQQQQQNGERDEEIISSSIFHIKTWPLRPNDKVPKLQRDNLLSLLYHADEQWLDSIRQLSNEKKGLDIVHHQQMIYLDILLLLHKSILFSHQQHHHHHQERGRLQEPILFAAQILYNNNNNNLHHLENYTEELKPFADRLILSLEFLRKVAHVQAVQSNNVSLLDTHLLQTRLDDFLQQWDQFESLLYQCYSRVVFGSAFDNDRIPSSLKSTNNKNNTYSTTINTYQPLPQELFSDLFTRLLPMTLRRALSRNIIHYSMIQDLDPVTFIAVPRLAVLSGMVYLNNVSGWRQPGNSNNYSVWFQSQIDAMQDLKDQVNVLEEKTVMLQREQERQGKNSNDIYSTFVHNWISLEHALVHGWQEEHDHNLPLAYRHIYISICKIADTLLADENSRSFIVILRYLFGHFADTSLASNNNSSIITLTNQDKQDPSLSSISDHNSSSSNIVDEQTILDLAI